MQLRIAILAGFALSVAISQAQQDTDGARRAYDSKIRETYNFRFGTDNISPPGNAAADGNDFIPASAFPTAEYCGRCHAEAYSQWRQALHSNSFRTPFYRTSVNILLRTKGIEFTRHCDSCHNPDRGALGSADSEFPGGSQLRRGRPHLHHLPFHSEAAIHQRQWRIRDGRSSGDGG